MKISGSFIRTCFPCHDDHIYISDKDYVLPTEKWIEEELNICYHAILTLIGERKYTSEFDCDNRSVLYYGLAGILHAKDKDTTEGIAVGEIWYRKNGGVGHGICAVFMDVGSNYELRFIEPGGPCFVDLDAKEVSSIYLAKF